MLYSQVRAEIGRFVFLLCINTEWTDENVDELIAMYA